MRFVNRITALYTPKGKFSQVTVHILIFIELSGFSKLFTSVSWASLNGISGGKNRDISMCLFVIIESFSFIVFQ